MRTFSPHLRAFHRGGGGKQRAQASSHVSNRTLSTLSHSCSPASSVKYQVIEICMNISSYLAFIIFFLTQCIRMGQ